MIQYLKASMGVGILFWMPVVALRMFGTVPKSDALDLTVFGLGTLVGLVLFRPRRPRPA